MSYGKEDGDLAPPPCEEAMINGLPIRDVFIPENQDGDIQAAMVIGDDDTSETNNATISTTKRISETAVQEIWERLTVEDDSGRAVDASEKSTLPPVNAALHQATNKTMEPSSAMDNMSQFSSSSCVVRDVEGEESICKIPRIQEELDQGAQLPVERKIPVTDITIHDLPVDAMLEILSYSSLTELIEVIPKVCTRWREFSHFPILWSNKKFCVDKSLSDGDVIQFLQQWPEVRNVEMNRAVESSVIDALCENCTHLEILKMEPSQKINYSLLKKFVEKCHSIRSLSIPCRFLDSRLKPRILAGLHHLRSLEVTQKFGKHIPIYLAALAYGCPVLSRLDLSETDDVSVMDFEQFVRVQCKTLTHAVLPWKIDDRRCVVPLLKECSSLIHLKLIECQENYEECFTILGNMSHLQSLWIDQLRQCPMGILDFAFRSDGLANLQVLNITNSSLDSIGMLAICKRCVNLIELDLTASTVTSKGLRQLHCLKKLQTLNLRYCFQLRGEALLHVAQLPKLRKLVLDGHDMRKLNSGMEHILDINSLEILSFGFNPHLSIFPFARIPGKLINLRVLNVYLFFEGKNILEELKKEMPGLNVIHPKYDNLDAKPFCESETEIHRLMKL